MTSADHATERDAFGRRLHDAALSFFDVLSIRLGDRLGLYQVLADGGALTSEELASRAGIADRYAREWLEQQTSAGIVRVLDASVDDLRFQLPEGHAEVLLDRDSLSYGAPLIRSLMVLTPAMDALVEAFRTGGGVAWESYGGEARDGVGDSNRALYLRVMSREWLPAIPAVDRRLTEAPPARIADIGCGTGWSSIAMALAYPDVSVHGFDRDRKSIEQARTQAAANGVSDRVTFDVADSSKLDGDGEYDLVTFFECLHDMARPVQALEGAREMLAEGGVVLVGDEPTNDAFVAGPDDLDRYHYGWSVFVCLPAAMTEPGSAATGAVMRPSTLRRHALEAGFAGFEVLPIEHDSFQLYLLTP
jgi:2-polyprenyl-3-methyl-5-hydroxy-6-metoxy-1,4-benzoquinol methylase